MVDADPQFNQSDIDDSNGPVDTVDDGSKTRLLVRDDNTGNATDAPGCPVTTTKLRYDFDDTGVTISTTFVTLFTYSGSGKFFGIVLDFNSDQVEVKCTIDSEVIFNLTAAQLKDIQIPAAAGQSQGIGGLEWENAGSRLRFTPPCAIKFGTDVKFEGKRTGASDKTLDRVMATLTKET